MLTIGKIGYVLKNGLSSLGKMPTIYHLWEIRFLWKHIIVGGLLMHMAFGSILKKYLWSIKYWLAKNNQSSCFAPKIGVNDLSQIPSISHLWGIKQLWQHNFVGGWFIHFSIHSFLKKILCSRIHFPSKTKIQSLFQPDRKTLPIGKIG